MERKNTLKKWGVGLKNKDKKEKEQIKKTKFSDIDLFEEGHEEEPDELDLIDGLIKDPATTQDKEHNAYLRLMHEYKAEYAKREKCIKVGILLIIISAVVFLALMFSLDSKTFFLTLWIIFIISGIAVMTRIDYRCYKYEKILGIKNTDKEDDLEKMKNDIDKTISNAKTELENATTQLEMNSAMGAIATLAEKHMLVALEYKLSKLSQPERLALLRDQREWQRWADRRNAESMGEGSLAPMMQRGREESRLKNRFLELTVPEDVRQAFIAMRNAPIRFQGKTISLWHGELDLVIPNDKKDEFTLEFETIAQLNIPFCRKIVSGKDTFHIGIIEPTNYGVMSSYGLGTESNLSIWKNGENAANHLLGKEITIQNIVMDGNMVKVSFLSKDGKLHQKEFDCQAPNDNAILINHWTTETVN